MIPLPYYMIPIFRFIQSAVYRGGVSKDFSCFTQMIDYNSKDLVRILTKIDTDNCLWMPYKCTKFQLDWSTSLRILIISSVWKDEEQKTPNLLMHNAFLGNTSCDFLQSWSVVFLGRQAPPQQLWCFSDKRSWSYECVKIATLLLLLIYSRSLHTPRFLGLHDTLFILFIYL